MLKRFPLFHNDLRLFLHILGIIMCHPFFIFLLNDFLVFELEHFHVLLSFPQDVFESGEPIVVNPNVEDYQVHYKSKCRYY